MANATELRKSFRNLKIVSPARRVFALFCLFLAVWYASVWIFSMTCRLPVAEPVAAWELEAQMRNIERRLAMHEDELHVMLIPEGTLFCNSLYGFGLISLAMRQPAEAPFRKEAIGKIEWLIDRVEKLARRHPFDLNKNLKPSGGIILAGHTNLLRAGYIMLGGKNPIIVERFGAESKNIFDAFMESKTGFPECYEGFTWAQDSVYALESLRLHDVMYGTTYGAALSKWLDSLKNHIDAPSGLMVAQVDPTTGNSIEAARGCATGWGLAYIPQFDSEFSKAQYDRFRRDWFVPFLGCSGIYEFAHGHATPTRFHAGPVIFNLGMAASGIGIAATRANGDSVSHGRLLRSLEFLGAPWISPTMEKSYLFGTCLPADATAFWGKTIVPWDKPQQPIVEDVAETSSSPNDGYAIAIGIVAVFCLSIIVLLARRTWMMFTDKNACVVSWKQGIVALLLQALLIAVFFFVSYVTWIQVVFVMAIVDMLEELSFRPSIVAGLYREAESASS